MYRQHSQLRMVATQKRPTADPSINQLNNALHAASTANSSSHTMATVALYLTCCCCVKSSTAATAAHLLPISDQPSNDPPGSTAAQLPTASSSSRANMYSFDFTDDRSRLPEAVAQHLRPRNSHSPADACPQRLEAVAEHVQVCNSMAQHRKLCTATRSSSNTLTAGSAN